MANFSSIQITDIGKELIARAQVNKEVITFTKIATSKNVKTVDELSGLTSLPEIMQEQVFSSISYISPNCVQFEASFTNTGLSEGYNVRMFGIFGKTAKLSERLVAVATVMDQAQSDWMSPQSGNAVVTMRLKASIIISSVDVTSVTINPDEYVTNETFEKRVEYVDKELQQIKDSKQDKIKTSLGIRIASDGITLNSANYFTFNTGTLDTFISEGADRPNDFINLTNYNKLISYIDEYNDYKIPIIIDYSNQVLNPKYERDADDNSLTNIKFVVNAVGQSGLDFAPYGVNITYDHTENKIKSVAINNILENKLAGQLGTLMRADVQGLLDGVYAFENTVDGAIASSQSIEVIRDWRNDKYINSMKIYDGISSRYFIDASLSKLYITPQLKVPEWEGLTLNNGYTIASKNAADRVFLATFNRTTTSGAQRPNFAYNAKWDKNKNRIVLRGIKLFVTLDSSSTLLDLMKDYKNAKETTTGYFYPDHEFYNNSANHLSALYIDASDCLGISLQSYNNYGMVYAADNGAGNFWNAGYTDYIYVSSGSVYTTIGLSEAKYINYTIVLPYMTKESSGQYYAWYFIHNKNDYYRIKQGSTKMDAVFTTQSDNGSYTKPFAFCMYAGYSNTTCCFKNEAKKQLLWPLGRELSKAYPMWCGDALDMVEDQDNIITLDWDSFVGLPTEINDSSTYM